MPSRQLKLYSQQPNGVTYADPLDPDMTVRFKTTASTKNLDGKRTQNFITEIIANENHPVSIDGVVVTDAPSVRIRTSGAVQSHARVAQMLRDLAVQVETAWISENVLVGFPPATPPINTVA